MRFNPGSFMVTTENTQGTGTSETSFRQFYFIFCFATVVKKNL